jgi:hypothetical protein
VGNATLNFLPERVSTFRRNMQPAQNKTASFKAGQKWQRYRLGAQPPSAAVQRAHALNSTNVQSSASLRLRSPRQAGDEDVLGCARGGHAPKKNTTIQKNPALDSFPCSTILSAPF